ncbi:porin [Oxalicibacterium faecigallinarum]|uniref:Porin n=1 Tax=Oxalicibacterium faecigallinarum TaxID=573741 RepID=A0A8J3F7F3_9BURK|nr:porin [Oxalicibacterium faecigallinarum]GGI21127.1 porin [Oxalicibacterium faecigallinarum]
MKKSLLALAVLGAFAGAASAQSSVTVYGIMDLGVRSTDNGNPLGRTNGIESGNQSASRIGFKGVEDLGGGMAATFQLEAQIAADVGGTSNTAIGSQNQTFNRLATVGLQGAFGKVDLGRQTSVIQDAYNAIDPFGDGGIAGITGFFFNGNQLSGDAGRISNSAKYVTPSFGGFTARAAYSFGESAGDTGANSSYGLGAAFVNGPLNVQFGYHNRDTSAQTLTTTPFVQTGEGKFTFVGATYNFGAFKLHGAYADSKVQTGTIALPLSASTKYRNAMVGVSVPVGPGTIMGTYAINDNRSAADSDAQRISLMYSYDLSKRTNLYTGYVRTSNDNGSRISLAPAAPLGESASVFTVGVRHKF